MSDILIYQIYQEDIYVNFPTGLIKLTVGAGNMSYNCDQESVEEYEARIALENYEPTLEEMEQASKREKERGGEEYPRDFFSIWGMRIGAMLGVALPIASAELLDRYSERFADFLNSSCGDPSDPSMTYRGAIILLSAVGGLPMGAIYGAFIGEIIDNWRDNRKTKYLIDDFSKF